MSAAVARLDVELVRRGLARSRARAAELVGAGRVRIGTSVARKPSQQVAPDAPLEVADEPGERTYVSRAAHKLGGALDASGRKIVGNRRERLPDLPLNVTTPLR